MLVSLGAAAGQGFMSQSASTDAPYVDMVYEVRNPNSGATMLTTYRNEVASATRWGFTEVDEKFVASRRDADGLVPAFRLYSPRTGDFLTTRWASERVSAMRKYGYVDQGRRFYVSPRDTEQTEPVKRYRKGPLHELALSLSDQQRLEADGWEFELIAFYALPTDADADEFDSNPTPTTAVPTTAAPTTAPPTTARPTTTAAPTTAPPTTAPPTTAPPTTAPPTTAPPTTAPSTTAPTPPANADGEGDGIFSIAVVPDTQREFWNDSTMLFDKRMDWLVDQRTPQDIRFVTQTGDLVDWGGNERTDPNQFEHASRALETLDNDGLSYLTTIGNHDTGIVCFGGGACSGINTNQAIRDTTVFNDFFPSSRQNIPLSQEFEYDKVDNAYKLFEAEGAKWMMLTLEMNPRSEVVDWADEVIGSHPNHNVIITSHYMLNGNGSISNSTSGYGSTSPRYIYDNLILQHENVRMVFSGHVGTAASRTDVGVNGNKVVSMVGTLHENNFNPTRMVTIDMNTNSLTAQITANDVKQSYLDGYPNTELPDYSRFDLTISDMDFITD